MRSRASVEIAVDGSILTFRAPIANSSRWEPHFIKPSSWEFRSFSDPITSIEQFKIKFNAEEKRVAGSSCTPVKVKGVLRE